MRQSQAEDEDPSRGQLESTIHPTLRRNYQTAPSFEVGKTNRALRIAGALGLAPSAGMSAGIGLDMIDQLMLNRTI
jgi:hypothetical protein